MIYIHPLSDVKTKNIGEGTTIWQYAVILSNAQIGRDCNINCHTFIENNVILGDYVTIKSGVYLWEGITIENNVFVGPNVTFTNDKYPRSKKHLTPFQKTFLLTGCSIGAGAIIFGGVTIGSYALIGAGSLVNQDIPPFALFYGNPGKIHGWVDKSGAKLIELGDERFTNEKGDLFQVIGGYLTKK